MPLLLFGMRLNCAGPSPAFSLQPDVHINLIQLPLDCGHWHERMARGPQHIVDRGAVERLEKICDDVRQSLIARFDGFNTEVGTTIEACRRLADEVRRTIENGGLPLVLAGNCNSALGTVSGMNTDETGIIWFDAHGDFNTPDTTVSGYFDGMGLAILAGRGWQRMAATIPGFQTVPENRILLIGGRDFDEPELAALEESGVELIAPGQLRKDGVEQSLVGPLARLAREVSQVYVHVDLDVHDPGVAPASTYSVSDGLSVAQMREALAVITEHVPVGAAAFAAYDPDCDPEGKAAEAGITLMEVLAKATQGR